MEGIVHEEANSCAITLGISSVISARRFHSTRVVRARARPPSPPATENRPGSSSWPPRQTCPCTVHARHIVRRPTAADRLIFRGPLRYEQKGEKNRAC